MQLGSNDGVVYEYSLSTRPGLIRTLWALTPLESFGMMNLM